jgi:hypothetical protein
MWCLSLLGLFHIGIIRESRRSVVRSRSFDLRDGLWGCWNAFELAQLAADSPIVDALENGLGAEVLAVARSEFDPAARRMACRWVVLVITRPGAFSPDQGISCDRRQIRKRLLVCAIGLQLGRYQLFASAQCRDESVWACRVFIFPGLLLVVTASRRGGF